MHCLHLCTRLATSFQCGAQCKHSLLLCGDNKPQNLPFVQCSPCFFAKSKQISYCLKNISSYRSYILQPPKSGIDEKWTSAGLILMKYLCVQQEENWWLLVDLMALHIPMSCHWYIGLRWWDIYILAIYHRQLTHFKNIGRSIGFKTYILWW